MIIELRELNELPTFNKLSRFPNEAGIYFLFKDTKLVYIGQSKNIAQRVKKHLGIFDYLKVHIIYGYNKYLLQGLELLYWYKFGKPHEYKEVDTPMTIEDMEEELYAKLGYPPKL